jgi:hypothetical protein
VRIAARCGEYEIHADPAAERDPRLITLRRGGTLTDEHHRLRAEWAGPCAEHVLHLFEREQSRDTRPRDGHRCGRAWVRGQVRMGMRDELLSRRMPPPADYPTRRSSPLSRPGKPRRWHTCSPRSGCCGLRD